MLLTEKKARGPCLIVSLFDTRVSVSTDPTPTGLNATVKCVTRVLVCLSFILRVSLKTE